MPLDSALDLRSYRDELLAQRPARCAQNLFPNTDASCSESSVLDPPRPMMRSHSSRSQNFSDDRHNNSISSVFTDADVSLDLPFEDPSHSRHVMPNRHYNSVNSYSLLRRDAGIHENRIRLNDTYRRGSLTSSAEEEQMDRIRCRQYPEYRNDYKLVIPVKTIDRRAKATNIIPLQRTLLEKAYSRLSGTNYTLPLRDEVDLLRRADVRRSSGKRGLPPPLKGGFARTSFADAPSFRSTPALVESATKSEGLSHYGDDFVECARRSRMARSRPASRADENYGRASVDPSCLTSHPCNVTPDVSPILRPDSDYRRRRSTSRHMRDKRRSPRASLRSEPPVDPSRAYNSSGVSPEDGDSEESPEERERSVAVECSLPARFSPSRKAPVASSIFTREEIYLIGTLRVPLFKLEEVVRACPPPPCWSSLRSVERIALVFHCALWSRYPLDITAWYNNFNKEFYSMLSEGSNEEESLYETCARMQIQHLEEKKREEESEVHLYGGIPEQNIVEETARVQQDDNGPPKYRVAHSFVTFGAGGRMILVDANLERDVVQLLDLKRLLMDPTSVRLIETINMFKGPLLDATSTSPHTVALFVRRQIERLRCSAGYPRSTDSLLIWQLLHMVVKQYGKVTGPDISGLLIQAASEGHVERPGSLMDSHRVRSATPLSPRIFLSRHDADRDAHQRMTHFLLEGHVDEAIEVAMGSGLFAEAMLLARRVDPGKLARVEARCMEEMAQHNPLTTLVTVASDETVPVLVNPPADAVSWRSHVAIVLANLTTPGAMQAVQSFGRVMAQKEFDAAADFCWLAVSLLTGTNPFSPPSAPSVCREHITLIHTACSEEYEPVCKGGGFALLDLFATEVFSYAVSLSTNASPLTSCIPYQILRIQYAKMLADLGFSKPAYQYCLHIAQCVWPYYTEVPRASLELLCEVAESVRVLGCAGHESRWVGDMLAMAATLPYSRHVSARQETTRLASCSDPCPPSRAPEYVTLLPLDTSAVKMASETSAQSLGDFEAAVMPCCNERNVEEAPSSPIHSPCPFPPVIESHEQSDAEIAESVVRSGVSTDPSTEFESSELGATSLRSGDAVSTESTPEDDEFGGVTTMEAENRGSTMPSAHYNPGGTESEPANAPEPIKESKGFLGRLREKLARAIPAGNEMRLPDDSQKTIVWDPLLERYVGADVGEESVAAPPPIDSPLATAPPTINGGLSAARATGRSRYLAPATSSSVPCSAPSSAPCPPGPQRPVADPPLPPMSLLSSSMLIPAMPNSAVCAPSPFSIGSSSDGFTTPPEQMEGN